MARDELAAIRTRGVTVPQSKQADPRQVPNSAGGFAFQVDGAARIHRFLTLGTTGGTYYIKAPKLTQDNAAVVLDWARDRTSELVQHVVEVSAAGRAPRNDQALFALAAAISLGDKEGKHQAELAVPTVVRTGTHLFQFVKYAEQFRGWGPVLRRAVASWYLAKDTDKLSYQLVKYRQREGWTHRDVLRSAHSTKNADQAHRNVFDWLCGRATPTTELPRWVYAYDLASTIGAGPFSASGKVAADVKLIRQYPGVPWEALPDEALTYPSVWEALLEEGVPMTALFRNLPRLTNLGVLTPFSQHLALVTGQMTDAERIRKARMHPVAILLAMKTYAGGHSLVSDKDGRPKETWRPVTQIIDAFDAAFYAAFPAIEPAGKRVMQATDTSGSMGWTIGGYPLTAAETVGAMAMATMASEPQCVLYGFSSELYPLNISPRMRLDSVTRKITESWGGNTDCSAPMVWALKNKVPVDVFQVYTDDETWYGSVHPHVALENYRQGMGIDAKEAVISVAPTEFTIADPDDPGTLDVSGFDSNVPALLADFGRGDI